MKAIRYAIYAVIALLLLAVAAVAIAVAVINPNDYKPQIEAAVEKQTNLDLMLEGDIGWSFIMGAYRYVTPRRWAREFVYDVASNIGRQITFWQRFRTRHQSHYMFDMFLDIWHNRTFVAT